MSELPTDQREYNRNLVAEFRAAGRRLEGRPLLLLTTTGRKRRTARGQGPPHHGGGP